MIIKENNTTRIVFCFSSRSHILNGVNNILGGRLSKSTGKLASDSNHRARRIPIDYADRGVQTLPRKSKKQVNCILLSCLSSLSFPLVRVHACPKRCPCCNSVRHVGSNFNPIYIIVLGAVRCECAKIRSFSCGAQPAGQFF